MKYLIIYISFIPLSFAYSKKELYGSFSYNNTSINFQVDRINNEKDYILILTNTKNENRCKFKIRRITAPVQTVSMSGGVSVYPNGCDMGDFQFRLISITYKFIEDGSLIGNVTIPKYLDREKVITIDYKK